MSANVYEKSILLWGVRAQQNQMKEECAELIVALIKTERKDKRSSSNPQCRTCNYSNMMCKDCDAPNKAVLTELADVAIMLEQMKLIYGEDNFKAEYERKLKRLEDKLRSST